MPHKILEGVTVHPITHATAKPSNYSFPGAFHTRLEGIPPGGRPLVRRDARPQTVFSRLLNTARFHVLQGAASFASREGASWL